MGIFIPLLVLVGWVSVAAGAGTDENDRELGRSVFESGIGREGREIRGLVHGQVFLSGAAVACAGCHGRDGRGTGESFIRAPDIRWFSLSKPYSARRAGGAGVPYDGESFAKALRQGKAPDGRRLDPAMPRFDLADDEVSALILYLSTIQDLSVSEPTRVHIFGLLPQPGKDPRADALARKLQNCPMELPGQRIAGLEILHFEDAVDAIAKVEERLREFPRSVLLAPYLLGWESLYAEASSRWNIQTLVPVTLRDPPEGSLWYFRFPGLESQIHSLLKVAKVRGRSRLSIVWDQLSPLSEELAVHARRVAARYGMSVESNSPTGQNRHVRWAKLWLTPFPKEVSQVAIKDQDLILMPGVFFVPEQARAVLTKASGAHLVVSYPYPPRSVPGRKWRTPVDAWAGAACALLAQLGERFDVSDLIAQRRVEWQGDLYLFSAPSEEELIDQVVVSDETRGE